MVTSEERERLVQARYADGIGVVLRCGAGLAALIATAYIGQMNEDTPFRSRHIAKPAISGEIELARADLPQAAAVPDTDSTVHYIDRASD